MARANRAGITSPDSLHWDHLRYFLAASRSETLAQAARLLKVSPPTVGRRLRALEAELKVPLFAPGSGELALTPAGRSLLAIAEQMERGAFELARLSDRQASPDEPPVRVTAIGSVALFVVRHFTEIQQASEGTAIEIISTGERLSLARNEADIALRMGRLPRKGDIVSRKLGQIAYALYASDDLFAAQGIESEDDARRAVFVGHKKNPKRRTQSGWVTDFGADGRFPLRVNELHLRLEAAKLGLGIALLPCHLADRCPPLRRVSAPPPELVEDIFLLLHQSRRQAPRIRRVSEALVQVFSEHRDELLG